MIFLIKNSGLLVVMCASAKGELTRGPIACSPLSHQRVGDVKQMRYQDSSKHSWVSPMRDFFVLKKLWISTSLL